MVVRRRIWLIIPAWLLFAIDITLTVSGQPPSYWAGDYSSASEANPVALVVLANGPWLFVGLAVLWAVCLGGLVILLGKWWAERLAIILAVAHAIGGCSWLVRWGFWGWIAAVGYLVVASELSRWCWRRAGCLPDKESQDSGKDSAC